MAAQRKRMDEFVVSQFDFEISYQQAQLAKVPHPLLPESSAFWSNPR